MASTENVFLKPTLADKLKALLPDRAHFEEAMSLREGFVKSVCKPLWHVWATENMRLETTDRQLLANFIHEVNILAVMSAGGPDTSEADPPRMMYGGASEIVEKVKSKAIEVRQHVVSRALAEIQEALQPVAWLRLPLTGLMQHQDSGKDSNNTTYRGKPRKTRGRDADLWGPRVKHLFCRA